ncbi:MAG TPA: ABC transporter permease [Thermodesulfobacteriota bacterium]|nr:ABC transporter permease [Thermodesulfobacteriota bacterium]
MYILKLLLRNAFRHKLRTALTILSITIAILAFGLLRTFVGSWYAGVKASSANRLVTRNAISLIFPLPLSYKDKIREVDGVKEISYGNWFAGVYKDEKNFFANYAIEARNYMKLYPEFVLPPDQKETFLRDRKGCVAGRRLIDQYHWRIGDIIVLKSAVFPGNWEFVLRGIYHGRDESTDERVFFFHWDYLNEWLKKTAPRRADQVGWYIVEVADPNRAAEVAQSIDKTFKNSLAETLTETEKAFFLSFISMADAIIVAIQLVSFVVIVIIIAVAANTMAMTARERIGEYAIFKTLGYRGWRIAGMIVGESLFITMIGCLIGIAFTPPAASEFSKLVGTYFPTFRVEIETIYMDIGAAVLVGLSAAVIPIWRALKIRIADGLRRIG